MYSDDCVESRFKKKVATFWKSMCASYVWLAYSGSLNIVIAVPFQGLKQVPESWSEHENTWKQRYFWTSPMMMPGLKQVGHPYCNDRCWLWHGLLAAFAELPWSIENGPRRKHVSRGCLHRGDSWSGGFGGQGAWCRTWVLSDILGLILFGDEPDVVSPTCLVWVRQEVSLF